MVIYDSNLISFKADVLDRLWILESDWILYWYYSVLGAVCFGSSHNSLYFTFKSFFVLYLALPQFKGASKVYTQFLRPVLIKDASRIDAELDKIKVICKLLTVGRTRSTLSCRNSRKISAVHGILHPKEIYRSSECVFVFEWVGP